MIIDVFDKVDRLDAAARAALPPDSVEVSASTGDGIDRLREAIAARVANASPDGARA